jgi:hypothetical protein
VRESTRRRQPQPAIQQTLTPGEIQLDRML